MTRSMPPRPVAARAYIDESIRESPPGHYVLAAAIVNDDQADVLRHMLRSFIPRRGRGSTGTRCLPPTVLRCATFCPRPISGTS